MDKLVQIKPAIPAWHQSTEFLTSCPTLYTESEIKGKPQPGGMESARGNEVHRAWAAYSAYCALKEVASDPKAFDEFAAGAGPLAARILAGIRDNFEVDYIHLLATELTMSLDEEFWPTDIAESIAGTCSDSGKEPMITGTLDALYSFPDQGEMRIDDAKTHPRPFDPGDKLQAKTYALLVLLHFPWVQKVTFRLIFVRYRNVTRSVEFTRDMIPDLMAAVSSARARQKQIHTDYEAGKTIPAIAGNHCMYCPLLTNGQCPIAEWNPQMQLTPAERLNFNLWYSAFSRANNLAMKTYIQETGKTIVLKDFNGKAYTYGHVEKETEVYPIFRFNEREQMEMISAANPVMPIIDMLIDYACDNPEDSKWMKNVVISSTSLRKYLKTNKRAFLDQAIEDTATKVTKTPLRVSKPLDAVPDEEDDDEEEWEEESEF